MIGYLCMENVNLGVILENMGNNPMLFLFSLSIPIPDIAE